MFGHYLNSTYFLRNQKHELEDKIHDLEHVVTEQRAQMAEYERRAELERSRAKKLEESLHQVGRGGHKKGFGYEA